MMHSLPFKFGSFRMALEKIVDGPDNSYTMKTFRNFATMYTPLLPKDKRVTFNSTDAIEAPDPTMLAFHLTVANTLDVMGIERD
ncbi:hypothetical protein VTN00DRAFT_2096 [Thermoascus crustaceus]|uniref:uncharacterized protein n=1 Tax=Thermoascus crustaceus TaxID=5088 RepID=UPI00374479FE